MMLEPLPPFQRLPNQPADAGPRVSATGRAGLAAWLSRRLALITN